MELQQSLQTSEKKGLSKLLFQLQRILRDYRRVFIITKKPQRKEFTLIAKVTAIGSALFGILGLLVYIIANILKSIL